jgi:hypothetical protein
MMHPNSITRLIKTAFERTNVSPKHIKSRSKKVKVFTKCDLKPLLKTSGLSNATITIFVITNASKLMIFISK